MSYVRRAAKAGSWYTKNPEKLEAEIDQWLNQASFSAIDPTKVRALIAPHAGHRYSGPTAAFAYKNVPSTSIKRVFLLGPSHHQYFESCGLSSASAYETPLGNIPLDQHVISELASTGLFEYITKSVDEAEHSLELHLPFIVKAFNGSDFKLVPILVGRGGTQSGSALGKLFSSYLDDPSNFFVISSDFCHWGERFSYQAYSGSGPIWKSIEQLDREGMNAIETLDPGTFTKYLKQTANTICGRQPITLLLHIVQQCSSNFELQFIHYSQSSACVSFEDSSVSYAAALLYPK